MFLTSSPHRPSLTWTAGAKKSLLPVTVGLLAAIAPLPAPLHAQVASAQVVPPLSVVADGTLNSTVTATPSNALITITNGTARGSNLFHSFSQFAIANGQTVEFAPAANIQNIITRVTGPLPSSIDGTLRAPANLFLLNPNGISFGPNAALQITGSFLASTAPILQFADGTAFSRDRATPPILTVSLPLGIQWGTRPAAALTNSGNLTVGQNLTLAAGQIHSTGSLTAPGNIALLSTGDIILESLNPLASEATALITSGGNIQIAAPNLTQSNSRITASPVNASPVTTSSTNSNTTGQIQLNIQDAIQLSDRSLITLNLAPTAATAATAPNRIDIQTNALTLTGGSRITTAILDTPIPANGATTTGTAGSTVGNITVTAPDNQPSSINLTGRDTGLFTTTDSSKFSGGNISLTSDRITLADSAQITTSTNSHQSGGNIDITTHSFDASSAAQVRTTTFGPGNGGDITINARDRINIIGTGVSDPQLLVIFNTILTGNSDDLIFQPNPAPAPGGILRIKTPTGPLSLTFQDIRNFSNDQTGLYADNYGLGSSSGNISFNAPTIQIANNAYISVSSSLGNAGTLSSTATSLDIHDSSIYAFSILGQGSTVNLTAQRLTLDNSLLLAASTLSPQGGTINLAVSDVLLLQNHSSITARVNSQTNGGNINFTGSFIISPPGQNNDIIATAESGRGGTIRINAKAILGLQYRPWLTPQSDITASSDLGTNGTVQIFALDIDPSRGLIPLPLTPIDASNQIAQTCTSQARTHHFIITGRGGLPPTPAEVLNAPPGWTDSQTAAHNASAPAPTPAAPRPAAPRPAAPRPEAPPPIIEATQWVFSPDGSVSLIAESPTPPAMPPTIACHAVSPLGMEIK